MSSHKQFILSVLSAAKGDDTYRAKAAFRTHTPEQMNQQYGQSGKTCNEILAGYQARDERFDAAIAWLNSIPA